MFKLDLFSIARVLARVRKRSQYKHVHQAADAYLPQVRNLVLDAFQAGHETLSRSSLVKLLISEDHAGLMIAVDKAITATETVLHQSGLEHTLLAVVNKSGEAAAKKLQPKAAADPKVEGITDFAFDVTSDSAISWAKKHAAELVQGVSKSSRDDIRQLVEDAFTEQTTVDDLADEIENVIGDEARAETIARTETMRASNAGQQEAWSQATQAGLLTGQETQEWIVTPDDRLCPICEELDGQTVGLDESFESDGDQLDGPPAHPNCRCTVGLSIAPATLRAAYSDDEPRDQAGMWTSGGAPGRSNKDNARSIRAKASHKPSTAAKQRKGESNEQDVVDMVHGQREEDVQSNSPMDVTVRAGNQLHGIEVKTLLDNSNDKITVHPRSRRRKEMWSAKTGGELHTVVLDDRKGRQNSGHRLYYRRGVGAFRLHTMTKVRSASHLRKLISKR